LAIAAAGCTYPAFDFSAGGAGGGSATASSGTRAASSSSSASSASGGTCTIDHLLISEVRSRGAGGAEDEFIELYNPTSAGVKLDATWALQARSTSATGYDVRWKGDGSTIPPRGHYLIAGKGYVQKPSPDGMLSTGITDAGSLVLLQGTTNVDAVCYAYDLVTTGILVQGVVPYTCNGTPAANPHDDTSGTDADASIERRPGGQFGNCTDTKDNAYDFVAQMPATPGDLASPPEP
jgi:hypothetical protein